MKNIILTIVSLLALGGANAQVIISPVGGLDMTGYAVKLTGGSYITDMHAGPCVGVLFDIPLKGILSPQAGFLYRMYTDHFNTVQQTYGGPRPFQAHRIVYGTLDIPFKLVYSFQPHNGNRFFVGAGPYAAVNVLAIDNIHGHYYDNAGNEIRSYDRKEEYRSKHIDIGAGIIGGFRAAKGWLIGVQGQHNLFNQFGSTIPEHNYNFSVLGGYCFKMKKHTAPSSESPRKKQ